MKRKIFALMIIFIAFISISSVSAFWFFDSGNDVTVYGENFHIPDGYDDIQEIELNSSGTYEAFNYTNNENHEFIEIMVLDCPNVNSTIHSLLEQGYKPTTIDGKEGYYKYFYNIGLVGFSYFENNKRIFLVVPYLHNCDDMQKYDNFLEDIII